MQITEILLDINANGRLPTDTPQKRIMHISGRWKKALRTTFLIIEIKQFTSCTTWWYVFSCQVWRGL